MCGISGIVKLDNSDLNLPELLKQVTNRIKHRGPDGEGFFFANSEFHTTAFGEASPENVKHAAFAYSPKQAIDTISNNFSLGLGHRRLSILDLTSTGHQPMCLPDKKNWITYNGEIYNYIELREELQQKGHNFITTSDTEVILKAYEEWGVDCITKFNGMWAFVIYDEARQNLFGSRDRFGVKPLYYIHTNSVFAFASEHKALLHDSLIKPEKNYAAVFDYFVFSKLENEAEGIFKNIFELKPASNFEFNLTSHRFKIWKYYQLPISNSYEKFSLTRFEELKEQTKNLVKDSVRLRMRSDVPVGSCLSGGLDSSSIVMMMHELLKEDAKKIHLFTARFHEPQLDEGKWAQQIVEATNSNWSVTYPTAAELKLDLENLMYAQDIPIWSTSTYAQYRVMQLAKSEGVKVLLDGQGGDELWAGYPHHQSVYMRELLLHANFTESKALLNNAGKFPSSIFWFLKQYFKHSGLSAFPNFLIPSIYSNYFSHIQFLNKDFFNANKHRFELHYNNVPKTLDNLLRQELNNTLLKGYLKCEDRCSMWHSVESRTPFADDTRLIELAFATPSVYKIHNGESKYIFRKAMQGIVPDAILQRKDKMGYTTPTLSWINEIKESLRDDFSENLSDVLDCKEIHNHYEKLFSVKNGIDNGQIFKFISYATWHKIFKL